MLTRRLLLRILPLTAGCLAACRQADPPPRYRLPTKPLEVLTSTVQAADLIRQIGGEAVNVRSLIPPRINPHLWQPTAADLAAIQIADVFFLSGLGLESRFTSDLEVLRSRGLHLGVLANGLADEDIRHAPDGKPDPHFWMDPRLWAKASTEAATVLSAAYPPAALWFSDRSHEFVTELEKLHNGTARQMAGISPRSRFLMSSHDTMAYFGGAYGLEVRSLANAHGEAPAQITDELAAWLSDHHVRTLFREHLTDAQTLRKLALPLSLNPELQIFSLSLAPPGTHLLSASGDLQVERYLPAMEYTVATLLSRLTSE